jgi:hypothetical protein
MFYASTTKVQESNGQAVLVLQLSSLERKHPSPDSAQFQLVA